MRNPRLFLSCCAFVLMGTDTCTELPSDDPVVSSDPELVARLEADHPLMMVMLPAINQDEPTPAPIPLDSRPARRLADLSHEIQGMKALTGAQLIMLDTSAEICGEDASEGYTFIIDFEQRRWLGRTRPMSLSLGTCDVPKNDTQIDTVFIKAGPPLAYDHDRVAAILADTLTFIMLAYELYVEDLDKARAKIQAERFGCGHNQYFSDSIRVPPAHGCLSQGRRHGPYAEGELSPLLEGPRSLEGSYEYGLRSGHWVTRDPAGKVIDEQWWDKGMRIDPPEPTAAEPAP